MVSQVLMRKLIAALLFILTITLGCRTSQPEETSPPTTVADVDTSTPISSLIPPAITDTPAITFTPTLTLTPWPTYPPEEALAVVLGLLETNASCKLPCWWGFTPGKSRWDDTKNFLTALTPYIKGSPTKTTFSVVFLVPENFPTASTRFDQLYRINNNTIVSIRMDVTGLRQYLPQQLMFTYGQPDEIWVHSYPSPRPDGRIPFVFVLLFSNKGIIAVDSIDGKVVGEVVRACPHLANGPTLGLWAPGEELSFEEASARTILAGDSVTEFKPLEDVTELTVEEFYLRYRKAGRQECLETPVDMWR